MLKPYLQKILARETLTIEEAEIAMGFVLENGHPEQTAAFLALLKFRKETADEIVGMVRALEKKAVKVDLQMPVMDIVGTGGDLAGTVNISTGSAFLAAACGVPVAKHGNRSASSRCGSADVLEAMGLEIEIPPEKLQTCLQEMNLAFMFAPFYHPSLKKIASIRKGLTFPTVFNLLGPLLNPARAEYALIGVAHESNLELFAQVILALGDKKRALIFHGCGLDELTPLGCMQAVHIQNGRMTKMEIDPRTLGFAPCTFGDLQGGDAALNAALLEEAFAGEASAIADSLILNAAAALYIFGSASCLQEGVNIAREVQRQGKALEVLNKYRRLSAQIRGEPCQII